MSDSAALVNPRAIQLIEECNLQNLNSLYISNSQLKELPETIGNLQNLNFLYISNSQLKELPETIGNLHNLNSLYISNSQLKELPETIGNLHNLNSLYISNSQLKELPETIGNLHNLNNLSISNSQLKKLPETIGGLHNLTDLSINDSQLKEFPEVIGNLCNLNDLSINDSQIEDLPEAIGKLTMLKVISLNNNKLKDYKRLLTLKNLKEIYLGNNSISSIDSSLWENKNISYLELENNPIEHIPDELLAGRDMGRSDYRETNCLSDLKEWFSELEKGQTFNYTFKLLILGNGRVGKSSIVDALKERPFNPKKESSHAILLEQWTPPQKFNIEKLPLEYFIWDFGGQEIYHSTHRWFMRSRALYLVVWERESEKSEKIIDELSGNEYDNHTISYWINSIRSANKKIPILLIENKIDKYDYQKYYLSEKELPLKYKDRLDEIEFSASSCNRYLHSLIHSMINKTKSLKEFAQPIPISWDKLRRRVLDSIFTDNGKPLYKKITKDEFVSWCDEAEVSLSAVDSLLTFLHRTGVVYYDEILLKNSVLLDQQWAIDAIYKALDRKSYFFKDVTSRNGKFAQYSLFRQWDKYDEKDRDLFLKFMISCHLCFQISDDDKGEDTEYAIPMLMNSSPSNSLLATWEGRDKEVRYLKYKYEFLHYGIIQQFLSKIGKHTKFENIWKNGIQIIVKGCIAYVEANIPNKTISIKTIGQHKDYLLNAISNEFEKEIDSDLEVNVFASNDGDSFYDLEDIKKAQKADNPKVLAIDENNTVEISLIRDIS